MSKKTRSPAVKALRKLLGRDRKKPLKKNRADRPVAKAVEKVDPRRPGQVIADAVAKMTERDRIDALQALQQTKRLEYGKAEVLLHADTRSAYLRHRAALKEPWTIAWIESCIAPGDVLYDIGANTGVYALLAAKLHGRGTHVYAFEPAFANYADLNRNIVLNDVSENVTPLPYALTQREQLLSFGFRNIEAGSAMHGSEEFVGKDGEGASHVLPVLGRPLDALVETLGLPAPNHIKIDVDGGEIDVLKGGARTLADPAVKSVMIEVTSTPEIAAAVDGFFSERGLVKAREFHKPTSSGAEERCWYGLYMRHPERMPEEAFENLKVGD